jgi:hypothetical protein
LILKAICKSRQVFQMPDTVLIFIRLRSCPSKHYGELGTTPCNGDAAGTPTRAIGNSNKRKRDEKQIWLNQLPALGLE